MWEQYGAWVELGYYSGIILVLIIWIFIGIKLGIVTALALDCFLQLCAGLLDLYVYRKQPVIDIIDSPQKKTLTTEMPQNTLRDQKIWGWRLASAVILLTVGVQVIIFNLAHHVAESFSPYILAIFYLGAAVSAVFFKRWNMELEWIPKTAKRRGYAIIAFGKMNNKKKISFILGSLLPALSVATVLIGVLYWNWGNYNNSVFSLNEYYLLIFVFLSTFFYGILELAILDRIGMEEQKSYNRGMILKTYGCMSIAAAAGLWILQITQSSFFGLGLTFSICFLFTILSIHKRKLLTI